MGCTPIHYHPDTLVPNFSWSYPSCKILAEPFYENLFTAQACFSAPEKDWAGFMYESNPSSANSWKVENGDNKNHVLWHKRS